MSLKLKKSNLKKLSASNQLPLYRTNDIAGGYSRDKDKDNDKPKPSLDLPSPTTDVDLPLPPIKVPNPNSQYQTCRP